MPAVDEACDEERDEEEAGEQDPQHQTELTVHALKEIISSSRIIDKHFS